VSNKKILVVEDDCDVRLGYQVLLQANHYDTFFAADAATAMNQAVKRQPDLIILDLGLPAGDGFLVLDRFRANTNLSMVPVVVVSARSFCSSQKRALSAGARAYLQKPWDDDELLALIGKLTNQPEKTLLPS
jgi:DNA-binding response OmpR family regulator